ncbi:hypothetical protein CDAR_181091 [Caerostris darwini]|uniref:Uncharacterized protein n=1 Tax=Caerostris darwini TaxID=1538125 RepID=A0AAV4U3U9_9ARAC|nr:hypothetical protein CDAR_181091 [Caerostris darwini]
MGEGLTKTGDSLLQPALLLAHHCLSQDHHLLKIAEKLAIPHHIRHAYEYPLINLAAARPAARATQGRQPQAFSQPSRPSSLRQPARPSSLSSGPSQPARQTRFFNLYTQGSRPQFNRRQS